MLLCGCRSDLSGEARRGKGLALLPWFGLSRPVCPARHPQEDDGRPMQFLEWSIFGLRAAWHVLEDPGTGRWVSLFPVVHIGEADFYRRVHEEAARHDLVVVEGVRSPVARRLSRVYRWIDPSRLGLVVQPKFAEPGVPVLLDDLPGEDFGRLWRMAPLWLRLTASRESIGRQLKTTSLPDRDDILFWTPERAPLVHAVETVRDEVLCAAVLAAVSRDDGPRSVAVIYGAAHFRALAPALKQAGFRGVDSIWIPVFPP